MVNYFLRGLRRIFGLKKKSKHKIAPYGSIARPKIILEYPSAKGKPNPILIGEKNQNKKIKIPSKKKSVVKKLIKKRK